MLTRLTTQRHDYNLKLTKDELVTLASLNWQDPDWDVAKFTELTNKMNDIFEEEAKRLGSGE